VEEEIGGEVWLGRDEDDVGFEVEVVDLRLVGVGAFGVGVS